MNKKGSAGGVLILIFLIIVLIGTLYYLYLNLPGKTEELKIINGLNEDSLGGNKTNYGGNYTASQQFYENMRFPDRRISYNIAEQCDDKRRTEALEAFSVLDSKTSLAFYEENEANAEISILCSDIAPEPEDEGHFIAGEGGPTEIINTSLYSVIFKGKMSLFKQDNCPTTHVALHEILHVLGFQHNNNPGSILYPTLDCNQIFDDYLIDEINKLYSEDGLPDLKIISVEGNKSGRYLNFDVRVVNQGLKPVTSVKLKVYGDEDVIEFRDAETGEEVPYLNLEDIDVGTTKIFTVQNAKLSSRGVQEITFIVDEGNEIKEIFENNNIVKLKVE